MTDDLKPILLLCGVRTAIFSFTKRDHEEGCSSAQHSTNQLRNHQPTTFIKMNSKRRSSVVVVGKGQSRNKHGLRKKIRRSTGISIGIGSSLGHEAAASVASRSSNVAHTASSSSTTTTPSTINSNTGRIESSASHSNIPPVAAATPQTSTVVPSQSTSTTNNSTALIEAPENSIPYQHLGLIDPSIRLELNLPEPKEGEKTMKDFCTKYKIPKEPVVPMATVLNGAAQGANAGITNANITTLDTNRSTSAQATQAITPSSHEPKEEEEEVEGSQDLDNNRSGPLVEMVNGEIVIQQSSIIVGGRQTTEEVDRQLKGNIVEEETGGITATYTSFRKYPKSHTWTLAETRRFYWALRQCGTDFSTMESFFDGREPQEEVQLEEEVTAEAAVAGLVHDGSHAIEMGVQDAHHALPGEQIVPQQPHILPKPREKIRKRTRRQLKSKYSLECRKNPQLIDMAMNPKVQLPLDLSVFGELDLEAAAARLKAQKEEQEKKQAEEQEIAVSAATRTSAATAATLPLVSLSPDMVVGEQEEVLEQTESTPVVQKEHALISGDAVPSSSRTREEPVKEAAISVIPLAVVPTKKKKSQRAKFRAKPRPKLNKAKARAGTGTKR